MGACMRDHAQWRNCTYVDLATMTTKTIALFCPPLDTHPVSRAVWRLQHAAGTTGARAVVAALKRCHANARNGDALGQLSKGDSSVDSARAGGRHERSPAACTWCTPATPSSSTVASRKYM